MTKVAKYGNAELSDWDATRSETQCCICLCDIQNKFTVQLGMHANAFKELITLLRSYGHENSRSISLKEQVAIFLLIGTTEGKKDGIIMPVWHIVQLF